MKMVAKLLPTIFTEDTWSFSKKISMVGTNRISTSQDENIDFFWQIQRIQLHEATFLMALPLPNKTKTAWPPKSLFLASQKKYMKQSRIYYWIFSSLTFTKLLQIFLDPWQTDLAELNGV